MASPSPKTATRRPPSTPSASITRGATARSAASPRVSSPLNSAANRRISTNTTVPEANETLLASLRQETDQKEQLLLQLQDKDQTIASLTGEAESLTSTLHTTEARLNELYNEQTRSEAELAQRIDIADKLRSQIREMEKEKRDTQRRYNEQTMTFEAERQAFYDNEQHLRSRIQSLSEALKRAEKAAKENSEPHHNEEIQLQEAPSIPSVPQHDLSDPENEPAEMTALKLELSTLATSHSSLQNTLVLLQTQLMDLKRVNNELQEENESYMILLREKTLNGQFDLMRQVGSSNTTSEDDAEDKLDHVEQHTDVGGSRNINQDTLDRVDEEGGGSPDDGISSSGDLEKSRFSWHSSRPDHKRTNSINETRGESLADLPITGPGLDLAAELGRAENKDMLEAPPNLGYNGRSRRNKNAHKVSGSIDSLDPTVSAEMETMRSEIKSLKDANKALSLYASKIIDRIIAQEGYEHVLAADYEKAPQMPSPSTLPNSGTKSSMTPSKTTSKAQFQSRSASTPSSSLVEFGVKSPSLSISTRPPVPNSKANHRSRSFDWRSISPFSNSNEKKQEFRPLTLKPGSTTLSNARKLDNEEDDEDRQERERLKATMKLMGIQPTLQSPMPTAAPQHAPIERSQSDTPPTTSTNRRFSFFGFGHSRSTDTNSDSPSNHTNSDGSFGASTSTSLTQEALEHAEAQNSLAALDAHEQKLSVELAKGGNSGFTEIAPRHGRRSMRSTGGSGSTVWSAGMSTGDE